MGVGLAFREELIGWIGKRRSLWVGGGVGGSRGVLTWLLGRIWAKIDSGHDVGNVVGPNGDCRVDICSDGIDVGECIGGSGDDGNSGWILEWLG